MAKMTLLEMTQDILSDMESDEVNSINDSVEALQVAQIIKATYFNIVNGRDYPHFNELFQLDSASDTRPTHMKIPDTIENVHWIKYNTKKTDAAKNQYTEIKYLTPEEFINHVDVRDSTDTKVQVVDSLQGIKLNIYKDRAPEYYTSFDEEYVVFDNYIQTTDTHLQKSKSQAFGKRAVTFTLSDNFTADFPVQMFSYFLAEAKSTAFITLKQMANPKAESVSLTQKRRMSQDAWKLERGIKYPNYGRATISKKGPNY
jgi:hypothetical protein